MTSWITQRVSVSVLVVLLICLCSDAVAEILETFDPIDVNFWTIEGAQVVGDGNPQFIDGNAMYFNGNGQRSAETIGLPFENGMFVQFDLKIGSGGGGSYFENADNGEDIVLEYAMETGNWVEWRRIDTEDSNLSGTWGTVLLPVPDDIVGRTAQLRWRQISHSGSNCDHWAIDNIIMNFDGLFDVDSSRFNPGFIATSLNKSYAGLLQEDFDVTGIPPVDTFAVQCSGLCFDLEINAFQGSPVRFVLPLRTVLLRNSDIAVFSHATFEWQDFTQTDKDRITSAGKVDGLCPEPGSDTYQPGLIPGHECAEITITEGGPNDHLPSVGRIGLLANIGAGLSTSDLDSDGLYDHEDNCPGIANPDQTDSDGDRIGDACDNCPNFSNPFQENSDGDIYGDVCDYCPEIASPVQADTDGDGISDPCDTCPEIHNPSQEDGDGDGVGDICDNCPETASPVQTDIDGDGLGAPCDNCPEHANIDQEDTDGDGAGDPCDNCSLLVNPGQADTNGDGYGNACDADLNNDLIVNYADVEILRSDFFTSSEDSDLNSDGVVNFVDLGIMKEQLFQPPGPSALVLTAE